MKEEFELLDKTELRVEQVGLKDVNLNAVADAVAGVLQLTRDEVFVIDARDDLITLDILRTSINADVLVGKESELIAALGSVHGLENSESTRICSHGVLEWLMGDEEDTRAALARAREMRMDIQGRIASRAIVFSTGPEVITGQIEDTNSPLIAGLLIGEGYSVTKGQALEDNRDLIAGCLSEAVRERGFGLILTTGGVGAEDKDHTVEAFLELDPAAQTPYIVKFEAGSGRHVKDGIRIAVAEVDHALMIALPGPNDEVQAGMQALLSGLSQGLDKEGLAHLIVNALRQRWKHSHALKKA